MKARTLPALALAILVAACGTTGENEATITNTPKPTSTTTESPTTTSPTSEPADPAEAPASTETVEVTIEDEPTEPVFVQCQLADGTALMSDGSTTYMDTCNESVGGPYLDLNGNPVGPSANGYSPTPTFDPDSADGYGPNQELPPFCDRFPDHETC